MSLIRSRQQRTADNSSKRLALAPPLGYSRSPVGVPPRVMLARPTMQNDPRFLIKARASLTHPTASRLLRATSELIQKVLRLQAESLLSPGKIRATPNGR